MEKAKIKIFFYEIAEARAFCFSSPREEQFCGI